MGTIDAIRLPFAEVSMRRPLIAVLVALSIAAAGCAASTPPAWTYAPPTPKPTPGPSGSPGASGAPSGAPAASAVASAVASAEAGASAPAGSGAAGAPVVIEALSLEFKTPEVSAPADAPFNIEFRNGDAGIQHNVEIKDASGASVFRGDIVTGVTVATYNVPQLAAGTYPFVCSVHPNMTGTLKVGG
jgi:plastocyanin